MKSRAKHRIFLGAPTALLFGALLGACGPSSQEHAELEPVDPSELEQVAAGNTITIRGHGESELTVKVEDLDDLTNRHVEIFEPFAKENTDFQGPSISDLVERYDLAGEVVDLNALDAYSWTADVDDLVDSNAILATRQAGDEIPRAEGGPSRVVFPDDSDMADELDAWVWSMKSMTFRESE